MLWVGCRESGLKIYRDALLSHSIIGLLFNVSSVTSITASILWVTFREGTFDAFDGNKLLEHLILVTPVMLLIDLFIARYKIRPNQVVFQGAVVLLLYGTLFIFTLLFKQWFIFDGIQKILPLQVEKCNCPSYTEWPVNATARLLSLVSCMTIVKFFGFFLACWPLGVYDRRVRIRNGRNVENDILMVNTTIAPMTAHGHDHHHNITAHHGITDFIDHHKENLLEDAAKLAANAAKEKATHIGISMFNSTILNPKFYDLLLGQDNFPYRQDILMWDVDNANSLTWSGVN